MCDKPVMLRDNCKFQFLKINCINIYAKEYIYWTILQTLETPIFTMLMSFSKALKALHFSDKDKHLQSKLNKSWPVFKNIYKNQQFIIHTYLGVIIKKS